MAPEQAKGKSADRRADIWAFGCVLYEMLTSQRAFLGVDVTDTIAAVVSKEPEWQRLPNAATAVRPLLVRCLKKDPKQRLQAIGDARIQIDELTSGTSDKAPLSPPPVSFVTRHAVPLLLAAATGSALIAALASWTLARRTPQVPEQPIRFEIVQSPALALSMRGSDRDIAISPDGRHIVYRAGGQARLALRSLDRRDISVIAGITSARVPFFSPDGQWIGFFDVGALKKVSIAGGSPVTLSQSNSLPRGASWGSDGSIVFATQASGGLLVVPASGGEARVLTTPDPAKGEKFHWFPSVLPGGRGVLFTIAVPGQRGAGQVAVLDSRKGERNRGAEGQSSMTTLQARPPVRSS